MKKILVIGSNGQIGTELVLSLRERYGKEAVFAADLSESCPEIIINGPYVQLDVLKKEALREYIISNEIKEVYLLAALLSATAEKNPEFAWQLNMEGLFTILNLAKEKHIDKIFWPSSIAVFGPTTPADKTPQSTIMEPSTVYGISKLVGEMATPQLPIAIIGNANEFYVEMQVDEYDISKMSAGQKVYITMDSYKDKVFEAVVTKIYPLMNLKLKSFKVDATFTNKPDNLFPNISAQANIVIQVKEKAMIIPRSYLIDNEYVYLKNKEKRKVKVGLMDYEKVEILSGISVNDELVKSIQ